MLSVEIISDLSIMCIIAYLLQLRDHSLLLLLWLLSGIQGQPDALNSAFHLTYNMVLNLLRVEEINPEYMLERSFYQFQNNSAIPAKQQSKDITTLW